MLMGVVAMVLVVAVVTPAVVTMALDSGDSGLIVVTVAMAFMMTN